MSGYHAVSLGKSLTNTLLSLSNTWMKLPIRTLPLETNQNSPVILHDFQLLLPLEMPNPTFKLGAVVPFMLMVMTAQDLIMETFTLVTSLHSFCCKGGLSATQDSHSDPQPTFYITHVC